MTPETFLITVLLIFDPDSSRQFLHSAHPTPMACGEALLELDGRDGRCVGQMPPAVAPVRPMIRPASLCAAPCTALRPQARP